MKESEAGRTRTQPSPR